MKRIADDDDGRDGGAGWKFRGGRGGLDDWSGGSGADDW